MQISTIERQPVSGKKPAGVSPGQAAVFWTASRSQPFYEGIIRIHAVSNLVKEEAAGYGKGLRTLVQAAHARLCGIDEGKWNYTRRHSREVATLSYVIAAEALERGARLSEGVVPGLVFAGGLAHDIGKTLLPRALLAKERGIEVGPFRIFEGTKLTDVERNALRYGHITLGNAYERLFWEWEAGAGLAVVRDMIGLHHVTYDGNGSTHPSYPTGLRGRALPLHCSIAKTADFVSAVRPRHYRPHYQEEWVFSLKDALAYAIAVAGVELSPLTVSCIISGLYDIRPVDADGLVRRLAAQSDADARDHAERVVRNDPEFEGVMGRRAGRKIAAYTEAICTLAAGFGITMAPEFPL